MLDDGRLGLISQKQLIAAFEVTQSIACSNGAVLEENAADWDGDGVGYESERRHLGVGCSVEVLKLRRLCTREAFQRRVAAAVALLLSDRETKCQYWKGTLAAKISVKGSRV